MRLGRRKSARNTAWLVVALTLLAHVGVARAQGTDATSATVARALFAEGVALADAGRWEDAVARFRRALALRDSSVIAYNLGVALTHEGHPVEAAEIFRRVIRSDATDDPLRADATASLATTEPQIAWATISYPASTDGLTLHVGGHERPIALLGSSMPLDPGPHEITLTRSDGVVVGRGQLTVAAGPNDGLTLTVVEAPSQEPTGAEEAAFDVTHIVQPVAPPPSDDTGIWIGVGIGGGVVLVAAAIVLVVVLVPPSEAAPYSGSLGTVEIGR